jgi:hypothetical protein
MPKDNGLEYVSGVWFISENRYNCVVIWWISEKINKFYFLANLNNIVRDATGDINDLIIDFRQDDSSRHLGWSKIRYWIWIVFSNLKRKECF